MNNSTLHKTVVSLTNTTCTFSSPPPLVVGWVRYKDAKEYNQLATVTQLKRKNNCFSFLDLLRVLTSNDQVQEIIKCFELGFRRQ